MDSLPEKIERYISDLSSKEDEVLQALSRETHLKVQMPQMLSGNLQGKMLETFANMMQAKRVLEIGTYTGYSAICLAKGMPEDGLLYTIDVNEELEPIVRKYIDAAGLQHKIKLLYGHALEVIPTLPETFDIVFIDADKINYCNYYDAVIAKVRMGGYIIADNVLWSGKVTDEQKDKDTQAIHNYNVKLRDDARVTSFILPLRDGLNIAQKIA